MEINVLTLLKPYDIDEEDFNDMKSAYEGIEFLDAERVLKNLMVLEQFGFPKSDINILLLSNPKILAYNPKILAEKLMLLGGDIETKLKSNPFLI